MKIRAFFSMTFLAALAITAEPVAAQDKKWTTVRIATEGDFRPMNFTKPDGTLDGYEIELYKVLCERMKVQCEVVVQPFSSLIPSLNAGKFDAIMSGLSVTPKRLEVVDFSMPYSNVGNTFAVLKTSALAALPDKGKVLSLTTSEADAVKAINEMKPLLKGKVVGVQSASIAAGFVDKYFKDIVTVREYKTPEEHYLDLVAGRVDIVVAAPTSITTALSKSPSPVMAMVGPRFVGGVLGEGSGVAIRKTDPELKALFNAAIASVKADGTTAKLSIKWFGYDTTPR